MYDDPTHPARSGARSGPTIALAIAVVGAAVLTVVAFGDLGGRDGGVDVSPLATAIPSATPSSDGGSDAIPIRVDLVTATRAQVYVDIVDRAGILTDAKSGVPGDGQSVEGQRLFVENLDATTLKLTWVDFPTPRLWASELPSMTARSIALRNAARCAQLGDHRSASSGLSLADVWLSHAKRAGRNQVVGL